MSSTRWHVWIGDLRGSRRLSPTRRAVVAGALRDSIDATRRRFKGMFKLAPRTMLGDEIQAVLQPEAPALAMLTYLRGWLALRLGDETSLYAGLGTGEVVILHERNAFESEGPAFHLARAALDGVKRSTGERLTGWIAGHPDTDAITAVVLPLLDTYFTRWSREQWEAVLGRLDGKTQLKIAQGIRVRPQAIQKRLSTARWEDVHHAIEFLDARVRSSGGLRAVERRPRDTRGRAAGAAWSGVRTTLKG